MKKILFALIWCIYSIESFSATEEVDTFAQEHVVVVGGGYAGVVSSLLLSRVQTKAKKRMYKVSLVEKEPYLFQGTSLAVGRLHLGGEYPRDETTATQCMDGAILFRQMFPPEVFSEYQRMAFMVSEKNDSELTPKELEERYAILKNKYAKHYDKLLKEYGERIAPHRFFGTPDTFYKPLRKEECPKGFAGGVLTQEKTWNVGLMGAAMARLLLEEGVNIYWREPLNKDSIEETEGSTYKVYLQSGEKLYANQIVNATGADIFSLYPKSANIGGGMGYNYYQRLIVVADISRCDLPTFTTEAGESIEAGIFGLLGEHGGMFNPITKSIALLYVPGKTYSHVQDSTVTPHFPKGPGIYELEDVPQSIKERSERIIESIKEKYGPENLKNMRFAQAIFRPTISADQQLSKRRYVPITSNKGYHNIVLTKATTAPLLGLELVKKVLEHSKETKPKFTEDIDEATLKWLEAFNPQNVIDPVLPADFRFMAKEDYNFKDEVTILLRNLKLSLGYNAYASPRYGDTKDFLMRGIEKYNMPGNTQKVRLVLECNAVSTYVTQGMVRGYSQAVTDLAYRSIVSRDQLTRDMEQVTRFANYCERTNSLFPNLLYIGINTTRALSEFGDPHAAFRSLNLAENILRRCKQNGIRVAKEIEVALCENRLKRAKFLKDKVEEMKSINKLISLGIGGTYSVRSSLTIDQLEVVPQGGELENSSLVPRSYKEHDFKDLVKKLREIHPEERKEIENQAFKIITTDMSYYERGDIIVALNEVHKKEREDVVNQAVKLVNGVRIGTDRAQIINAISQVPEGERE